MCDLACISGFLAVGAILVAFIANCEGLFCFDSGQLSRHRARRPYRPQD
jgi:hypothetical protein